MTAAGNTTAEMVRQLAMALTGYEARVVVHSADYTFSLEFLGKGNTLADIDVSQVRKMVEQIKPAHLQFIISGLTWNDIESVGLTWQWFDDTPLLGRSLKVSSAFIKSTGGEIPCIFAADSLVLVNLWWEPPCNIVQQSS